MTGVAIVYGVAGTAWSMHKAIAPGSGASHATALFSYAWIAGYAALYMALDNCVADIERRRRTPFTPADAAGRDVW